MSGPSPKPSLGPGCDSVRERQRSGRTRRECKWVGGPGGQQRPVGSVGMRKLTALWGLFPACACMCVLGGQSAMSHCLAVINAYTESQQKAGGPPQAESKDNK